MSTLTVYWSASNVQSKTTIRWSDFEEKATKQWNVLVNSVYLHLLPKSWYTCKTRDKHCMKTLQEDQGLPNDSVKVPGFRNAKDIAIIHYWKMIHFGMFSRKSTVCEFENGPLEYHEFNVLPGKPGDFSDRQLLPCLSHASSARCFLKERNPSLRAIGSLCDIWVSSEISDCLPAKKMQFTPW